MEKEQKPCWNPTEEDVALFNKAITTNASLSPQERAKLDILRMKFKHRPVIEQKEQKSAESDMIKGGDFISDGKRVFLVLANVKERNLGETGSTFCEGHILGVDGVVYCNGDDFKKFKRATSDERAKFIHDLKVGVELKEQPAEWSEGFEQNIKNLLHDKLTWHSDDGSMSSAVFIDDKTIKDIVTGIWFYVGKEVMKNPNMELPEQEWSEEDEKSLNEIIHFFESLCSCLATEERHAENRKWLKFLKSLHPSWKPSEQEKSALRTAIYVLTEERNFPKAAEQLQAILDAFDGKESRKNWKPSEEQMKAIRLARSFVMDDFDEHPTLSEILMELEEQLKKLM